MTSESIPRPEAAAQHWLSQQHQRLIDTLREVLDLDTGLREILSDPAPALPTTAGRAADSPVPPALLERLLALRTKTVVRDAFNLLKDARLASRSHGDSGRAPDPAEAHTPISNLTRDQASDLDLDLDLDLPANLTATAAAASFGVSMASSPRP